MSFNSDVAVKSNVGRQVVEPQEPISQGKPISRSSSSSSVSELAQFDDESVEVKHQGRNYKKIFGGAAIAVGVAAVLLALVAAPLSAHFGGKNVFTSGQIVNLNVGPLHNFGTWGTIAVIGTTLLGGGLITAGAFAVRNANRAEAKREEALAQLAADEQAAFNALPLEKQHEILRQRAINSVAPQRPPQGDSVLRAENI